MVSILCPQTDLQEALQKIRQKNTMRREVTVELSSQGFWKSGIRSDVCQVHVHKHTFTSELGFAEVWARAQTR